MFNMTQPNFVLKTVLMESFSDYVFFRRQMETRDLLAKIVIINSGDNEMKSM